MALAMVQSGTRFEVKHQHWRLCFVFHCEGKKAEICVQTQMFLGFFFAKFVIHSSTGNVTVQFCRLKHCLTRVKEKVVKDSLSGTTSEQMHSLQASCCHESMETRTDVRAPKCIDLGTK